MFLRALEMQILTSREEGEFYLAVRSFVVCAMDFDSGGLRYYRYYNK